MCWFNQTLSSKSQVVISWLLARLTFCSSRMTAFKSSSCVIPELHHPHRWLIIVNPKTHKEIDVTFESLPHVRTGGVIHQPVCVCVYVCVPVPFSELTPSQFTTSSDKFPFSTNRSPVQQQSLTGPTAHYVAVDWVQFYSLDQPLSANHFKMNLSSVDWGRLGHCVSCTGTDSDLSHADKDI